jgi:hypothetical protein
MSEKRNLILGQHDNKILKQFFLIILPKALPPYHTRNQKYSR